MLENSGIVRYHLKWLGYQQIPHHVYFKIWEIISLATNCYSVKKIQIYIIVLKFQYFVYLCTRKSFSSTWN